MLIQLNKKWMNNLCENIIYFNFACFRQVKLNAWGNFFKRYTEENVGNAGNRVE